MQEGLCPVYRVYWAFQGWDLREEEPIAGGVLLRTRGPHELLSDALYPASLPRLLWRWREKHGPGVAVVLDNRGRRRGGPFYPPTRRPARAIRKVA